MLHNLKMNCNEIKHASIAWLLKWIQMFHAWHILHISDYWRLCTWYPGNNILKYEISAVKNACHIISWACHTCNLFLMKYTGTYNEYFYHMMKYLLKCVTCAFQWLSQQSMMIEPCFSFLNTLRMFSKSLCTIRICLR